MVQQTQGKRSDSLLLDLVEEKENSMYVLLKEFLYAERFCQMLLRIERCLERQRTAGREAFKYLTGFRFCTTQATRSERPGLLFQSECVAGSLVSPT